MAVLMDASPYFEKAAQMLEKLPAADVAPVVRCKDCKHYLIADEFEGEKRYMCEVNHYAAATERRDVGGGVPDAPSGTQKVLGGKE
jgi:hypothetical protein